MQLMAEKDIVGSVHAGLNYIVDTGVPPVRYIDWPEMEHAEVPPQYQLHDMTIRNGRPLPPADSPMARLVIAAGTDPDAFRALLETVLCTALPREVLARPGMLERIDRACTDALPRPAPGPDRRRLLELLAA